METWKIVLVPRPLRPLSAYVFFLLKHFGFGGRTLLHDKYFCRWTETGENDRDVLPDSGYVINLAAPDAKLREVAERLLATSLFKFDRRVLERLRTYTEFQQDVDLQDWLNRQSVRGNPYDILRILSNFFTYFVKEGKDPWDRGGNLLLELFATPLKPRKLVRYPSGTTIRTLPVLKRVGDQTKTRVPYDYTIRVLEEGKAFDLIGERIGICIGGEPNTGKSTLAAALYIELNNLLKSLASRGGKWKKADDLKVGLAQLDLGTPVSDAIVEQRGLDREYLKSRKTRWSIKLAQQSMAIMTDRLQESHIVIGDLPGRIHPKIELLTAPCAYGIITWEHIEDLNRWRGLFNRMGIRIIGEVKKTTGKPKRGEEYIPRPSLVMRYYPGELISGRILGMDRIAGCWDTFISTYAAFLLYDILPTQIRRYEKSLQKK